MVTLNNRAFMYFPGTIVSTTSCLKQITSQRGKFIVNGTAPDVLGDPEKVNRDMPLKVPVVRIRLLVAYTNTC